MANRRALSPSAERACYYYCYYPRYRRHRPSLLNIDPVKRSDLSAALESA